MKQFFDQIGGGSVPPRGINYCPICGAAHREVREETGLTIMSVSIINAVSNLIPPRLDSLVIVLLAELLSGTPAPGDDIGELAWITSDMIPSMAFDADRYIIDEYFAGRLSEIPVDSRFAE